MRDLRGKFLLVEKQTPAGRDLPKCVPLQSCDARLLDKEMEASEQKRTIVVTGGTGGIGFHSALGLARTGARVLVTGRDASRGEEARRRIAEESGNARVELVVGDVSSIAGVDALASELLDRVDRVDVLVNNVGYFGNELRTSEDGLEMHFAVNVLSPWRLTYALLPALRAAGNARVLNLTAGDNSPGAPVPIDADNLQAEKGFKGLMTMAHSKSVMEAMSIVLARELGPDGITVNIVFPGRASTTLTRSVSLSGLPGAMKLFWPCLKLLFRADGGKGAARASASTIWCATHADVKSVTGCFLFCERRTDGQTGTVGGAISPTNSQSPNSVRPRLPRGGFGCYVGCLTKRLTASTGGYFGQDSKRLEPHPKSMDASVQARIVALIEAAAPTPNRCASGGELGNS